jgi:hypothetical protein
MRSACAVGTCTPTSQARSVVGSTRKIAASSPIDIPAAVRAWRIRSPRLGPNCRQSNPRNRIAAGTCRRSGRRRFVSHPQYVATETPICRAASRCSRPRLQRRARKVAPSVPSGTLTRSYRRSGGRPAKNVKWQKGTAGMSLRFLQRLQRPPHVHLHAADDRPLPG